MAKTAAAFLRFLDDAALFYKRMVMQLQVGVVESFHDEQKCFYKSFHDEQTCWRRARVLEE